MGSRKLKRGDCLSQLQKTLMKNTQLCTKIEINKASTWSVDSVQLIDDYTTYLIQMEHPVHNKPQIKSNSSKVDES